MQRCSLYSFIHVHAYTVNTHTHTLSPRSFVACRVTQPRMKTSLNLSVQPRGHISINHLTLYMIPPPSPHFIFRAPSSSLPSHTFPQPGGLCPGHPPRSLSSPLPWHPRTSLHVPLAVRDPEVN